MSKTTTNTPTLMFTDEAWEAGWAKAQSLGLAESWAPAARPVARRDVEEIVSAVVNHGFEEFYVDQMIASAEMDALVPGAMDGLRQHMRNALAIRTLEEGCVMLTLPREVSGHPVQGMTRIRLIVPVRRLAG